MLQNLQNFAIFQKLQLDNLVDSEKCCKTHISLQKSEPIQPKTSNILPKFALGYLGLAERYEVGVLGHPAQRQRLHALPGPPRRGQALAPDGQSRNARGLSWI